MHISSMTIDNYRTFRHVVFHFDRQVNYMVGDNNIGKSNFLCLLKWISMGMDSVKAISWMQTIPSRSG